MDSRVDKYTNNGNLEQLSRSNRNSKLYKEVYGRYRDLDNLPMTDNTDEIDMDKLKEMLNAENRKRYVSSNEHNLDVLEPRKRNIDESKVYDINKLLEKAKYENSKIKEPENKIINNSRNILSTLEETELSVKDIKNACQKYDDFDSSNDYMDNKNSDNLSMTREMKYHTRNISVDPMINQVVPDNDLSLDLLSDLKPTGNTIVTKPIVENSDNKDIKTNSDKFFPTSGDTSDIDVIKKENKIDNDFFTSSYQFSKNDFADDDDFYGEKSHNFLKVILLIIAIIVFAGVIFYFVLNYGISA